MGDKGVIVTKKSHQFQFQEYLKFSYQKIFMDKMNPFVQCIFFFNNTMYKGKVKPCNTPCCTRFSISIHYIIKRYHNLNMKYPHPQPCNLHQGYKPKIILLLYTMTNLPYYVIVDSSKLLYVLQLENYNLQRFTLSKLVMKLHK